MQSLRRRVAIGLLAAWALAAPAAAQSTGEIDGTRLTHLVDVDGAAQASVTITGTFSGTITFKVQHRNRAPVVVDCFTPAAPTTAVNSTTGTGSWSCPVAGFHFLEVQFSSYSSGTATILADTANSGPAVVGGAGGGGSFDGLLLDAAGGDPITDTANDALRVNIVAGAGSGGTAIADDAAFTAGTTNVTPAGAVFDDTTPDSVNEGDAGAVRMSGNRNMYTTIRDAAGNERGLNVAADGSIAVTVATVPSHAVTNAGTFAVQAAQSGTWNVTNVSGTVSLPTGASTAANQSTAITALQLIDNIPITIGSTTSGQSGALVMGAVTTSAPTYTTAQSHPLSLDTTGSLRVAITSGAGSGGTALADDADFTAGTTSFTPFGGFYQSTVTACTDGDACAARITAGRALTMTLVNPDGSAATYATDATVGTAAPTTGPLINGIYKEFDGSALPTTTNVNTEGEASPVATSLQGVQYVMVVSEDGSLERGTSTTPMVVGDGSGALNVIVDSGTVTTVSTVTSVAQLGGSAVPVEDAAETAGGTGLYAMSVRRDTAASSAGTAGDNATLNTDSLGRLWVRPGNPCEDHARVQSAAISNSTSGNVEVVALNGSDLIYVCGYSLVAGAATGVRFVYGTGTACATGETGLTGAWSFAANGGISQPNGGAPQFVVPAGNAFCTENTGANAIAGHVTYVRTAAP